MTLAGAVARANLNARMQRKRDLEREVLEGRAQGVCIRMSWKWVLGHSGDLVTREVNRFAKQGLLHLTYYSGGKAAAWPTAAGEAALREGRW